MYKKKPRGAVEKVQRVLARFVPPSEMPKKAKPVRVAHEGDAFGVSFSDRSWTAFSERWTSFGGIIAGRYSIYADSAVAVARALRLVSEKEETAFGKWFVKETHKRSEESDVERMREIASRFGYEVRKARK